MWLTELIGMIKEKILPKAKRRLAGHEKIRVKFIQSAL